MCNAASSSEKHSVKNIHYNQCWAHALLCNHITVTIMTLLELQTFLNYLLDKKSADFSWYAN